MDKILKPYRPYRSKWMHQNITNNETTNYIAITQSSSVWYDTFLDRIFLFNFGQYQTQIIGVKYIFDTINN
jgi:hypothetical protein